MSKVKSKVKSEKINRLKKGGCLGNTRLTANRKTRICERYSKQYVTITTTSS
jgi:hypothetical protein